MLPEGDCLIMGAISAALNVSNSATTPGKEPLRRQGVETTTIRRTRSGCWIASRHVTSPPSG